MFLRIATLATIALSVSAMAHGQPHLFYTDLENGPNTGGENNAGAFVTLYGNGFGNTRGNSLVNVGSGRAAAYPIWTDTKVTIQLGEAATTGNIVVSAKGQTSNPLPFTVRPGRIFFVATNGRDGANGSFIAPWRTLLKARNSIRSGDIVYVRDGVVHANDDGEGWKTTFLIRDGGKTGQPKAIVAYPGAHATVGSVNGPPIGIRSMEDSSGNWVFAGLTLVGEAAVALSGSNHWRFVGNDITCPNGDGAGGCFEASNTSNVAFLGNRVHDAGKSSASSLYHGVYFTTNSNHIEVGWNVIENIHGCRGLQFHSSDGKNQYDLSVHDNLIHDTQCDGIIFATVDPSRGKVEAFNNVIYNAGQGPNNPEKTGNWACIFAPGSTNIGPPGGGTVEVYNNTLYNCGSFARPPYDQARAAVMNGGGNPNLRIRLRNNIVFQAGTVPYVAGPRVVGSNNVFYGSGAPLPNMNGSIQRNPLFLDVTQGDFHLDAESPARKAGTDTGLNTDRDGNPRPAAMSDLGAFQYLEPAGSNLSAASNSAASRKTVQTSSTAAVPIVLLREYFRSIVAFRRD